MAELTVGAQQEVRSTNTSEASGSMFTLETEFGEVPIIIKMLKPTDCKVETESEVVGADSGTTAATKTESLDDLVQNCIDYQTRKFKCPYCARYTTETEEKLQRHIKKLHLGQNPFSCYMCDYSTDNKTLFEDHVNVHQGIKPYECKHCGHKTTSKKNLKKHEQRHAPDNPLKCTKCPFIAQHKYSYLKHLKEDCSKPKRKQCRNCDFSTSDLSEFKEHSKAHKTLCCTNCNYKTKYLENFETHAKGCSTKKQQWDKNMSFTCAICNWTSKIETKILLHLIHHPDQVLDASKLDLTVLKKHGIIK